MTRQVTFNPYGITIRVEDGENLLRAALDAGVHINASCGGEGVCGKCKVILESGEIEADHSEQLSAEGLAQGFRQACQSRIKSDVVIRTALFLPHATTEYFPTIMERMHFHNPTTPREYV